MKVASLLIASKLVSKVANRMLDSWILVQYF